MYDRLHNIEDDEHEVLWIRLKPKKLPRKCSCIIIACIYHPPGADNGSLQEYLITSLDTVLRRSPDCGVILSGDFNQFNEQCLLQRCHIPDGSICTHCLRAKNSLISSRKPWTIYWARVFRTRRCHVIAQINHGSQMASGT